MKERERATTRPKVPNSKSAAAALQASYYFREHQKLARDSKREEGIKGSQQPWGQCHRTRAHLSAFHRMSNYPAPQT